MKIFSKSKTKPKVNEASSFLTKNKMLIVLALFALAGSLILLRTNAETSSRVALIQAENMKFNSGSKIEKIRINGRKRAIKIKNGSSSSVVNLTKPSNKVVIRARGEVCEGAPILSLTIGNGLEQFITINSKKWSKYTLTLPNFSGDQAVTVSLKNNYSNSKCIRSISLDYIELLGSAEQPPVVPLPDNTDPKPDTSFNVTPGRNLPDTLYGVTIESVDDLSAVKTSLSSHTKRPTTRIVFQKGTKATNYSSAVNSLRETSYVMGEILDSTALKNTSVDAYKVRTREFASTFGNKIDIYEIGNELNGSWVGQPADINAKVQASYDVIEKEFASSNLRSAITLNYWPSSDCYGKSWEDTASFANGMPAEVKNGVDYVFLSFYETACSPRAKPTNQQFIEIFNKLKTIFPNAKIGMGEIGAQGKVDGLASNPSLTEKQQIANRYYGMHSALKTALGNRYVGGYFWWYYYQDAVPSNKANSMWQTLETNFNSY